MDIYETIFLSVVAGVLTAFILFVLSKFVTLWLVPQYQIWRYQGADVNGIWVADLSEDNPEKVRTKYSLNLKQRAHDLKGTLHFEFESDAKSFTSDFEASGEYWEGYFTITFKSVDRKRFSRASMVMKLVEGGGAMVGHFSFRNVVSDTVNTVPLALIRS
ncbi:hypothetical protein MYE70_13945 [Marinobacter alexandrii]|uniref:hypothetical protein n=1 Tax=Marinobacter alexandrii TaxID=2570351 RepID=UPI001FFFE1AC|nr:hypothetical protein [Marinobacter alexandrii]MCK2150160.1 hypothetical protein [Marinobacter alexandrii]